jgi:hypothetical protein
MSLSPEASWFLLAAIGAVAYAIAVVITRGHEDE